MDLESSWVLWQNGNDESNTKSWEEDIIAVGEVSTVPEFLYLCDEITKAKVDNLCTMNLFKKGIKPMWEDEANIDGGRLITDVSVISRNDVNELWKRTMAFCVSNSVDNICGCVFNEKQAFYKIAIWFGKDYNQDTIRDKWLSVLGLNKSLVYSFLHRKSLDTSKGRKKWGSKR